jgi:hypothetical protein
MRNLLTRVPKTAQAMVATLVRTIFAQPDAASVWAQHTRVVDQLTERFPDAAGHLADAALLDADDERVGAVAALGDISRRCAGFPEVGTQTPRILVLSSCAADEVGPSLHCPLDV